MHSMNLKNQILTYNKYTVLTISLAVLSVLSPEKFFSALRTSVWSRNKGGGGGGGPAHPAPPQEPPPPGPPGPSPGSATDSNARKRITSLMEIPHRFRDKGPR